MHITVVACILRPLLPLFFDPSRLHSLGLQPAALGLECLNLGSQAVLYRTVKCAWTSVGSGDGDSEEIAAHGEDCADCQIVVGVDHIPSPLGDARFGRAALPNLPITTPQAP